MKMRYLIGFLLILTSCHTSQLIELASKYSTNTVYLDGLQKQLRLIYSDNCDFDADCFRETAEPWLEDEICPEDSFKNYGFVSQKECERAGKEIMDLVTRKTETGKTRAERTAEREQARAERETDKDFEEKREKADKDVKECKEEVRACKEDCREDFKVDDMIIRYNDCQASCYEQGGSCIDLIADRFG